MSEPSQAWRNGFVLSVSACVLAIVALVVALIRDDAGGLPRDAVVLSGLAALGTMGAAIVALRSRHRQVTVEHELQSARRTFEGILTIASDAIISIDADQRITLFNNGAESLFGYQASEMIGQPLALLLPERYRTAHVQHVEAFGRGPEVARRMGERRAIFGRRRDGSEFPAEASISRLDVDGSRLYTVVMRDITQRVRADERQRFLARAGVDLTSSLEVEPTLVVAVHAGIPLLGDCAILDLVEPSGEWRRRCSVHDDPDRTRVLRRMEGRLESAPEHPFPVARVLATGQHAIQDLRGSTEPAVTALGAITSQSFPLRARGRVFGVLTLVTTDPARRAADDDVAVAHAFADRVAVAIDNAMLYDEARRASRARDEILQVVSHDLRNPLSGIAMCARVLADQPPDDAAGRRELARGIQDGVAFMNRLIQDLLDVSTIESGHLRIDRDDADLVDVARRALAMVAEPAAERGISLEFRSNGALPAHIDAIRIEQVIANLLANAVKFTDREGRITIEVREAPAGLHVEVSDTGIGIPAEALPHIFDRFWHARRSGRTAGTGLGLAIARGIVEAHGGAISVASAVGQGTTISFHLPVLPTASPRVLPEVAGAAPEATPEVARG
ncbi:MAG: PAS domain S-box protein [Gemmatimonadaceae bacterium]|nr:PAS domain S-box protein [Gemmatimonadaceae bacterium]